MAMRFYFVHLPKNLDVGKQRTEIKEALYSFPHVINIVFYRIYANYIRIVSVLDGNRDLKEFL